MIKNLSFICISPTRTIRDAISFIDRNSIGIVLVVDEKRRLIDTVTDGDVRRAILAGAELGLPIESLLKFKPLRAHSIPITAKKDVLAPQLLRMMNEHSIRHIPIVDDEGCVMDVVLLEDLVKEYELPLTAVIMAGGYGTRLRPFTNELPKPMLLLGDKPLLERLVKQLKQAGIRRINLATHYKEEVISNHFQDGREFGVEIQYVKEDQPLGTAGVLSQLSAVDKPLLVINGDILTKVDFRAMLDFHIQSQADMTVAVRQFELDVPYGVVETHGVLVTGISEKPILKHFINAGIYLLNPGVCRFVPVDKPYHMPDLIQKLLQEGERVASFPVHEYWIDIGRMEDYEKAQLDLKQSGAGDELE